MKACVICSVDLTPDNWAPDQRANWVNKCRECIKADKREYQKAWREKNPGMASVVSLRSKAKLRREDPVKARAKAAYSDAKKRAARNGMEFDLTAEDVVRIMRSATICPYIGWSLTFEQGSKANTLASLDRIDSSKGYTRENVQVISYLANLMKSHANDEELTLFAQGVLALRGFEKSKGVAR